jgi:hypothetical protein
MQTGEIATSAAAQAWARTTAAFFLRNVPTPSPAKPISIIAQVEASGAAKATPP